MGLLEQIEQKAFLGSEFLLWLWFRAETQEGAVRLDGETPVEIAFQDSIVLESEYGEATRQTLKGDAPGMAPEARAALVAGKTPQRVKMRVAQDDLEWTLTVRADTLDFGGIKVPAPRGLPFEESIALRLQALERLEDMFERLMAEFLAIRLDAKRWADELKRIREWIENK